MADEAREGAGSASRVALRVKDRYRIEKELGRGGVGVVYLAHDEQLHDRAVVIKVLLDRSAESEWFQKKFKQEIQALVRLEHPGIVGALDVGEMPDGKPFFVMQFVPGETLRALMKREPLGLDDVASIVRQVGSALTAAHDKGVHHRDLKPENIMLQDLGHGQRRVMIIDFGIASVQEADQGTQYTQVAGTVVYMAPEQLMGRPQAASDTYALAVIAYELLVGEPPFRPGSPYELPALQQQGVQSRPSERRKGLSPAVDEEILRALSLDPHQRQASSREFAEQLSRALTSEAVSTVVAPMATDPTFRVSTLVPSSTAAAPTVRATAPTANAPAAASAPSTSVPLATAGNASSDLEIAHVLFTDIVGYSMLPMDHQRETLGQLQAIVQGTEEYRRALPAHELVSLPTGDGMALVFFRDPTAPLRCALEVAQALKAHPRIGLRMGIHSGPVYRVADINANLNVAGGGINIAQRVMDAGDAGHILLSRAVADVVSQLSMYSTQVHDLGEHAVKHGVKVQLFNLYAGDLGNQSLPSRLRAKEPEPARAPGRPSPRPQPSASERKKGPTAVILGAVGAVVVVGLALTFLLSRKGKSPEPAPAPAKAVEPASPRRELSYYLTVQKYRSGQPYREPFQLSREMLFGPDDRLRVTVSSPQSGYLYIVNEGPEPAGGKSTYNVLFPTTTTRGGSAQLSAGQAVQIPEQSWFQFDEAQGTERLWMVFAGAQVPELEAVKGLANSVDRGTVRDAAQAAALRSLFAKAAGAPPEVATDEKRTVLRGRDDRIVSLLKLEHQ